MKPEVVLFVVDRNGVIYPMWGMTDVYGNYKTYFEPLYPEKPGTKWPVSLEG